METKEEVEITLAKKGDINSFNRLVERYQNQAFGLSLRMLGEREEALDVIQDSFLKAWLGITKLKGESFRSWLLSIIANSCRDRIRKRKKEYIVSLEEVDIASPLPSPEEEMLEKELREEIQRGLSSLPFKERLAVTLFDIQGFSLKEMAGIMECKLRTAESRLNSGRKRLRTYLRSRNVLPQKYYLKDRA
jgi:RNA polymerase sigma-70 factor (ECF subfamily)